MEELSNIGARVIQREYASLRIIAVVDSVSESPLAMLDLIQFIVDVIDRQFDDVTEMDLIFNPEKLASIVDEIVVDGIVISTDLEEVCGELQRMR